MRLLDDVHTPTSRVTELVTALEVLGRGEQNGWATTVSDHDGNPIERVKLFENTLTDGSKTLHIELHFQKA